MDFFVYWMLIDPKFSAANLIKRFQQTRDNQFWESVWRNFMFVRNILIIDKPSRGGLWKCTDTLSYSCQGLVKVILVSYFENKLPFEKLNLAIKQLWWNFYLNKWWEKEITFLAPLGSLAIGDSIIQWIFLGPKSSSAILHSWGWFDRIPSVNPSVSPELEGSVNMITKHRREHPSAKESLF